MVWHRRLRSWAPRMQKLHADSLVVCHQMIFLKTRPFVKRNAEFTNVSSFTSLLMCSTHFTLSCRILSFFLPTTNNFFKFVYSEITGESAWWVLFRPPWRCLFLWQRKVIRIGLFWYPGPSSLVQEVLVLYFFCLSLVSCTQKMRWREHSLADTVPLFRPFYSFPQNWVIIEVLVCLVNALHEFIVLDNSIRLLYFHVCFPVFLPCVTIVASWIVLIVHTSLLSFTTCTIMSPFLRNADCPYFKHLSSPSRLRGMPLLALIVPQTLTFLSSNVWANLTLL